MISRVILPWSIRPEGPDPHRVVSTALHKRSGGWKIAFQAPTPVMIHDGLKLTDEHVTFGDLTGGVSSQSIETGISASEESSAGGIRHVRRIPHPGRNVTGTRARRYVKGLLVYPPVIVPLFLKK